MNPVPAPGMIMKYAHTNIISNDWRALADFYIAVFDCKPIPPGRKIAGKWLERRTGVKKASLMGVHLLLPGHGDSGPTLEIFQYTQVVDNLPSTPNRKGFAHIAFEVENVGDTLAEVLKHSGRKYGEITRKTIATVGLPHICLCRRH